MKKIYLLVSGLVMMGTGFAQLANSVEKTSRFQEELASPGQIVTGHHTDSQADRAAGDLIWSTNFDVTTNWQTTVTSGAADADHNWIIGTDNTWFFTTTEISSTSGGNYAVCKNGNASTGTQYAGGNFILELDTVFDLSSYASVLLEFEQYGAKFNDDQKVQVSTNGGTVWNDVYTNADKIGLFWGAGEPYANPDFEQVDITSAISANPANVRIRLLLTWDPAVTSPGITYGWFVDDLALREGYDNDLSIHDGYLSVGQWPSDISQIPGSQSTDVTFSATVSNNGNMNVAGVVVNADVTPAGFSGSSAPVTINAGASDSLVVSTVFTTPTANGLHEVDFMLSATPVLDNTWNDVMTETIRVTTDIMACDHYDGTDGSITGSFFGWSAPAGGISSIGNIMEVYADGVIGGIRVGLREWSNTATSEGNILCAVIYKYDDVAQELVYEYVYENYIVEPGDVGSIVEIIFPDQLEVTAGEIYYIGAGFYDGTDVPIMMSGESPIGTVIGTDDVDVVTLVDADPNETNIGTPVVRAIFKDFTSTGEIPASTFTIGQNVPNPFGNTSVITYSLTESADVSVKFVDLTGKTVKTVNPGTQAAGTYTISVDANDLAEGTYLYTFTVNDKTYTKQMVVTK